MIHDALNIHEYFWAVKECKGFFSQFILFLWKYSKFIILSKHKILSASYSYKNGW
jgi:hypothetical protein